MVEFYRDLCALPVAGSWVKKALWRRLIESIDWGTLAGKKGLSDGAPVICFLET